MYEDFSFFERLVGFGFNYYRGFGGGAVDVGLFFSKSVFWNLKGGFKLLNGYFDIFWVKVNVFIVFYIEEFKCRVFKKYL